jgi:hypothetical protein
MVFNNTFNNISVISWWLVLLLEETWRKPGRDRMVVGFITICAISAYRMVVGFITICAISAYHH